MLTSAQIKKLSKGTYPNHQLVKMFPNQQGHGRSARMKLVNENEGKEGAPKSMVQRLINFFTGKEVAKKRTHKHQAK